MTATPRRRRCPFHLIVPLFAALCALAGCTTTGSVTPVVSGSTEKASSSRGELPKIAKLTEGAEFRSGLLDLYVDVHRARVFVALPAPDPTGQVTELIYIEGLASGLGSNPIGLDRGRIGGSRIVQLRRVGRRLLVEQPNLGFRANTENPDERRAVEQSFATSVLWAGAVVAEDPDGRFLVDFTDFVVRDAHSVVARLKSAEQGSFSLDASRSVLDPAAALAFPDNVELEALLTFTGSESGPLASSVTPTPDAITLVQHHSFVRLPGPGYVPRRFDPRMGSWSIGFADYAAPLDESMTTKWIGRHRLRKTDPSAERTPVVEPIVYYVDRGAPEPVRQALVDGAAWWAAAFEAAGFEDAFRVEIMPEGAHPLDVRYNVIQWVHRSTRGWSYGNGVVDPRTGEIIKGHVSLGSLRVRQDRLLFEGLLGTANTGSGAPDDPVQLALARIRQLSAHEVGHTIGLTHNFAASTYAGRASVMDYPAPLIVPTDDGGLDLGNAYGVGVGAWDVHAVRWAYGEFPPGVDEAAALESIVRRGIEDGLIFITDHDARPRGGAHPLAHLWDNGSDPVDQLRATLEVRRRALAAFAQNRVAEGQPLALLHEVFVPVYLHHRFQVEAAVKLVGGVDYAYSVRGDAQPGASVVPERRQREALSAVVAALDPRELDIDESTLSILVPRPFGFTGRNRELFVGAAGPVFDALGAAATAADLTIGLLLEPERMLRLVDQHRRDSSTLSLGETLDAVIDPLFERLAPSLRLQAVQHVVQRVLVDRMIERAADDATAASVRALVEDRLEGLRTRAWTLADRNDRESPHYLQLAGDLQRYLDERKWEGPRGWRPAPTPPGSPIGAGSMGGGCGGEAITPWR